MLFRIVMKPKNSTDKQSYPTYVVCTQCGQKNTGSSYKSDALMSMAMIKCTHCGEQLNNQELLNKKIESRLEYHKK